MRNVLGINFCEKVFEHHITKDFSENTVPSLSSSLPSSKIQLASTKIRNRT